LPGHQHAHLGFFVLDQLARDVHRHLVNSSVEAKRRVVVVRDRFAEVVAAAQPLDAEDQWHGHFEVGIADQLAVKIELRASRRPLALGNVRLARRLELVAELGPPRRNVLAGRHFVLVQPEVVVNVVKLAVLDVQRETARNAALRQQHTFGPAIGDRDLGRDAVRPVEDLGRRTDRNH